VQSALVAVFLTKRNLRSKKLGACLVIGNRKVTSQGLQLAALRSQVHQIRNRRLVFLWVIFAMLQTAPVSSCCTACCAAFAQAKEKSYPVINVIS